MIVSIERCSWVKGLGRDGLGENIVAWTMLMVVGINTFATVLSYAMLLWPPYSIKIQERSYTVQMLNSRMPLILMNIVLLATLSYFSLSSLESVFYWDPKSLPILALEIFVLSLVDDAYFYAFHRWMHENKWVYKKVHLQHHRAFTPVPIEYIYVHPFEWIGGSGGIFFGALTLFLFEGGQISAYTFLTYAAIRSLHELDIHSGIRSKVFPKALPFIGSTEHHDLHHSKPNSGNYGSTYLFWDILFKTRATHAAD